MAIGTPGADSAALTTSGPEKISYLSAEWINDRINHVMDRMEGLAQRLLDGGLLSSGYLPFETPITDEMLEKMTPAQFSALFSSMQTLGEKSQLLDRVKHLKLPPSVLLPFATHFQPPTGPHPLGLDVDSPLSVQS